MILNPRSRMEATEPGALVVLALIGSLRGLERYPRSPIMVPHGAGMVRLVR